MELALLIALVVVFVIASFLGSEIISKVPSTLHTPLMSGSNAVSGITIVGSLIVCMGAGENAAVAKWIAFGAVILAMINVVGGFVVTDRMLQMFKKKEK